MPTLELTNEQVVALFGQLPRDQQDQVFQSLVSRSWEAWSDLSHKIQAGACQAARDRGLHWEKMSDEEKEELVDDIVHEDR